MGVDMNGIVAENGKVVSDEMIAGLGRRPRAR